MDTITERLCHWTTPLVDYMTATTTLSWDDSVKLVQWVKLVDPEILVEPEVWLEPEILLEQDALLEPEALHEPDIAWTRDIVWIGDIGWLCDIDGPNDIAWRSDNKHWPHVPVGPAALPVCLLVLSVPQDYLESGKARPSKECIQFITSN